MVVGKVSVSVVVVAVVGLLLLSLMMVGKVSAVVVGTGDVMLFVSVGTSVIGAVVVCASVDGSDESFMCCGDADTKNMVDGDIDDEDEGDGDDDESRQNSRSVDTTSSFIVK